MDYKSKNFDNLESIPPHSAGVTYVSDDVVELDDAVVADNIIGLGFLPADCIPIDIVISSDQLDSNTTATMKFDVGILNDAGDDLESILVKDCEAGDAVNVTRGNYTAMMGIARNETADRVLAAKVTTVAATPAAGELRAAMSYRASNYGA